MNDVSLYFSLGTEHILSLSALDHMLFIAALCLRYEWSNWRKLLILVTAFTIGHSITLALATLQLVSVPTEITEMLIAATILITALNNLTVKSFQFNKRYPLIYAYALLFGLVHGLGFSRLLRSMLGKDESIIRQLLFFNLGIEAGQLCIVACILMLTYIFVSVLHINRREYLVFVSGSIAALAMEMIIERIPV